MLRVGAQRFDPGEEKGPLIMATINPAVIAVPMHGQRKLALEGYRTRDGHMIEWFGHMLRAAGPVSVVSRPEPVWIPQKRYSPQSLADNTEAIDPKSWRIPDPRNRRRWWVQSASSYPVEAFENDAPVVVWNPFFAGTRAADAIDDRRPFVIDLLDDWTEHFAFASIAREVEEAYRKSFERATAVFANAEGTAELARRFGRDDVVLLTNGTDPERFSQVSRAAGPITIGYVGKIGKRVDLELILEVAGAFPSWKFVFAGPILDREYQAPLVAQPNIELLGDVHYNEVPKLLETFDLGWVPHRVGEGEVGGDVIKTYEYRAAALPVLSTPIVGAASRGLDEVHVVEAGRQADWLAKHVGESSRLSRVTTPIPQDVSWKLKATQILEQAGVRY